MPTTTDGRLPPNGRKRAATGFEQIEARVNINDRATSASGGCEYSASGEAAEGRHHYE